MRLAAPAFVHVWCIQDEMAPGASKPKDNRSACLIDQQFKWPAS